MTNDSNYIALANVMFGYARRRADSLVQSDKKLAHYTSSENALNIINKQTMWLRSAAVMNDHSEIEHGRGILEAAMGPQLIDERFSHVLDHAHSGLAARVKERALKHPGQARHRIFMASLSETETTERLGRLSMWRAYGGKTSGTALIFNRDVFEGALQPFAAVACPVLYGGVDQFKPELEAVIEKLELNPDLLSNVSAEIALNTVSWALDFAILSIKHLGFEEEREWRVIHRPFEYSSAHVLEKVTSVTGTPQLVYQMPLVNEPGLNMPELSLDRLLHRVVIGPSLYPETTWRALVEALRNNEVQEPERRVVLSDIPFRQTG